VGDSRGWLAHVHTSCIFDSDVNGNMTRTAPTGSKQNHTRRLDHKLASKSGCLFANCELSRDFSKCMRFLKSSRCLFECRQRVHASPSANDFPKLTDCSSAHLGLSLHCLECTRLAPLLGGHTSHTSHSTAWRAHVSHGSLHCLEGTRLTPSGGLHTSSSTARLAPSSGVYTIPHLSAPMEEH
jgi:hypothetical protein